MSNAEQRMTERYTAMMQELRIIAKWFNQNHGGPDVNADDVEDATLRSLTFAMSERRGTIGKQMIEIENFAAKNKIELPE
jgi:hypothetical protein